MRDKWRVELRGVSADNFCRPQDSQQHPMNEATIWQRDMTDTPCGKRLLCDQGFQAIPILHFSAFTVQTLNPKPETLDVYTLHVISTSKLDSDGDSQLGELNHVLKGEFRRNVQLIITRVNAKGTRSCQQQVQLEDLNEDAHTSCWSRQRQTRWQSPKEHQSWSTTPVFYSVSPERTAQGI